MTSYDAAVRVGRRYVQHGGDGYTVNVGPYSSTSFIQSAGPSYREIVDLSNLDASLFVHPMGQMGSEFSPLYSNLLADWYLMRCAPQRSGAVALSHVACLTRRAAPCRSGGKYLSMATGKFSYDVVQTMSS